ncbi:UNVERIFIED_CONTAM: hypothetical protein Scaly_1105800 [Sesamum calycinum]|uniref:RING-CH-type domain-containing protein n=1 Tax=Sesamum calycinum TaxID=2727403 RepID=A0AAW2QM21_9LAMI
MGNAGSKTLQENHVDRQSKTPKPEVKQHMTRSFSVPVNVKTRSLRRTDSSGDDAGEDIPEEEAVCRICLVELGEGGETLKMECSCKGELALAHKECAVKWFSIKDAFDVYSVDSLVCDDGKGEGIKVSDMGPRALAISLPFSCVLGLLSSMIASTMVSKSYIWAYASFQFAIVILFAHIFYAVLNVNAILSVLLSSFTGFGIAISTNSLLVEYLRWRASRYPQSSPQQISGGTDPSRHEHRHHQHRQRHQYHHQHRPPNSNHNNRGLQTPTHNTSAASAENTGQQEIMHQNV